MDLGSIKKSYDIVVSLGSGCEVAHQLQEHKLRSFSGPLDWKSSLNMSDVSRLLGNKFDDFMEAENMEVIGQTDLDYRILDKEYNVISVHDFPLDQDWNSVYPSFKNTLNRRIDQFLNKLRTSASVLFIRREAVFSEPTFPKAIELRNVLSSLTNGPFDILIVNIREGFEGVLDEQWETEGICSITVPFNPPMGDDMAWDEILSGVISNEYKSFRDSN